MTSPIVLAEAAQDALERFGEVTGCLQYEKGWSCTMPATPDGPPHLFGHDDCGNEVWIRRYRCVAGHWYHLETPTPDADVVDGCEGRAMPRASAAAS